MSDFECFTRLFNMMHIFILNYFYFFEDIHFLKAFYNSLTAKNRFVIKCT